MAEKLTAEKRHNHLCCCNSDATIAKIDTCWAQFHLHSMFVSTKWVIHSLSSLSAVTHAPFHTSMLRAASQAGPMRESAGVGKLVNAALLSFIDEACANVCCVTLLSSEHVGPACVQAWSSNQEAGRVGLMGRNRGERILSDVVPVYLYCPAFSVGVSLGV